MSFDFKTLLLTLLALVAFASNSLLTRLALGTHAIDAATFTLLRLAAGALVLTALVRVQSGTFVPDRGGGAIARRVTGATVATPRVLRALGTGGFVGPLALFAYAGPFSFAYGRIGAATGALVLFGVVQLTMIAYGLARGERPSALVWLGIALASAGLAILMLPSATRPDPIGLSLMALSGAAWGVYSLAGRATQSPLAANARNFALSSLLGLLLVLVTRTASASGSGIALALVSGGVTSGLGYAIWYRALPRLTVTEAAVAQLAVPIIAALGAAMFLNETITPRLVLSGITVLGGVGLVATVRTRARG